jgi:hypothetical protein
MWPASGTTTENVRLRPTSSLLKMIWCRPAEIGMAGAGEYPRLTPSTKT